MRSKQLHTNIVLLLVSTALLIVTACCVDNSIIVSIVSTLLGSAVTFALGRISSCVRSMKSQFSGYYRSEIYSTDNPTEIIKRDKFRLIEKDGNVFIGEFSRYFPKKDRLTRWNCSGQIVLDQFLLTYRALDDTTPSRGVILVKQDTTRRNDGLPRYTGKYCKFEGEKIVSCRINLVKIDKKEYDSY